MIVKKPIKIVIALVAVAALAVTAGPFIYINFVKDDAPEALSLDDTADDTVPSTEEATLDSVDGQWQVVSDEATVVGYRVEEVLFGQSTEGVGRTREVEGSLTIESNTVSEGSFTVQMGTLTSDAANRDRQFNGRIMDTATHPTSTFTLSEPIVLPAGAIDGERVSVTARGQLTLRGVTRSVEAPLEARLNGTRFTVVGNISIVFEEWGIPEPSLPGIDVEPNGLLEFSLVCSKKQ